MFRCSKKFLVVKRDDFINFEIVTQMNCPNSPVGTASVCQALNPIGNEISCPTNFGAKKVFFPFCSMSSSMITSHCVVISYTRSPRWSVSKLSQTHLSSAHVCGSQISEPIHQSDGTVTNPNLYCYCPTNSPTFVQRMSHWSSEPVEQVPYRVMIPNAVDKLAGF